MLRGFSVPAFVLLAATSMTAAQTAEPAADRTKAQLAAHLGVDPDDYTLSELARLNCRVEAAESDAERRRLLESPLSLDPLPTGPADHSQLAASLGVDPDLYTASQLALLKTLIEDDNCNIRNPQEFAAADERITDGTARAKSVLATSLGVDPVDYTLHELVEMRFGEDEG